jgi:hypothetical protein
MALRGFESPLSPPKKAESDHLKLARPAPRKCGGPTSFRKNAVRTLSGAAALSAKLTTGLEDDEQEQHGQADALRKEPEDAPKGAAPDEVVRGRSLRLNRNA